MQPVDRAGNRAGCARTDVAENGAAMNIQMIKCIPGPDHLEVLVQHNEKLARVRCACSSNIHCSQIPAERGDRSIGQAQDFVMKPINNSLAFRAKLSVDGVNVGFAQRVAREIDLAKDIEASLLVAIATQEKDCAAGHKDSGSPVDYPGLHGIDVPLDGTLQVRCDDIDGVRLRSRSEVVIDHVLTEIASAGGRPANGEQRKV